MNVVYGVDYVIDTGVLDCVNGVVVTDPVYAFYACVVHGVYLSILQYSKYKKAQSNRWVEIKDAPERSGALENVGTGGVFKLGADDIRGGGGIVGY